MTVQAAAPLLTRGPHRPGGGQVLLGDLCLRPGRVHEFCGGARRTLALMLAGRMAGPVFWIAPSWTLGGPNPDGFRDLAAPGRFTFVAPQRPEDLLWCMEEALRAGVVGLVIADLPAPPGLTPVRRLHLAAEAGAQAGGAAPLGVVLTPGTGGAAGVESRWSLAPRHDADEADRWLLHRRRARTAPEAAWHVGVGIGASPGQGATLTGAPVPDRKG